MLKKPQSRNAWSWVPSLYYAEGIPYVVVMLVSVIMYKRMGISNADIALYTSWLYLPWVIKPLWSPFIDLFKTKRFWIVIMQMVVGAGLAGVAFAIPAPNFLQYTLAFFFLIAFSSATHDIAADGFYMLGLTENEQALHVGIRSTFYRLAMITGQGLLIILAGYFEIHSGLQPVDFTVNAAAKTNNERLILPDSISAFKDQNDLKIVLSNSKLVIPIASKNKAQVDSLIFNVQTHNIKNASFKINNNIPALPVLKTAPADVKKNMGNVGVLALQLSKMPLDDKDYVVNIDNHSGSKDITILEGARLVFNKNNWNKPSYLLFQVDAKLNVNTVTTFRAISGDIPWAWKMTFLILTGLFLSFFLYHYFILPYPVVDKPKLQVGSGGVFSEFIRAFSTFFKRKNIGLILTFLLIYRFGEAQLVKLASPFLLDAREVGGLGLTTGEVGLIYGTVGVIALTSGGILGGIAAAKGGLKKWIWWMFAFINIPHILYIYLAYAQPTSVWVVASCVAGEQFGYGFGFTAYMLYMIYASEGEFKTAHYAICTGFMALSMMLPGMFSGYIQQALGYQHFFIWILVTMIPGFFITKFIPIDPAFGIKNKK